MFHNIGILAHVDAGKTTLTEQLLFLTGVLRSPGSVDLGTTATDNLPVERARGISVRTSTATARYGDATLNIIDTPGHVDFAGEVERSLLALDYAVVVVSAVEGVRSHTENILHALEQAKLPYLVFINKIDRVGADFKRILTDLHTLSARKTVLLSKICEIGTDKVSVSSISGASFAEAVTEALCDTDTEAENAFLSDKPLPESRASDLLRREISRCNLTSVLCGSAKLSVGVRLLTDFMISYMPDSKRRATDSLSGVIFKIEHDKTMGKVAHVRLFGGSLSNRNELELPTPSAHAHRNPDGETDDAVKCDAALPKSCKILQIRKFTGDKSTDVGEIHSGDVAAVYGLANAKTGQFFGSVSGSGSELFRLTTPILRVRVTSDSREPDAIPGLARALAQLSDEEPYIDAKWENGQKEIIINTTGKIQLEIIDTMLRERYQLTPRFSPPTVIYKETPQRPGFAYADYTMPKPCWAVVKFLFEPMPRGYGVSYHGKLPSEQCLYRYQSHIRTAFYRCLEQGLFGWEVTDFKCTLVDGQSHNVHTHPLDFFVCTPMAFMNGMNELGSTVLEPLLKLRISAPSEIYGKITSEIIRMGGEYDTPLVSGTTVTVEAVVPVATSMDFPVRLASLSSGKAVLSTGFYGYRECRDGKEHINPRLGVNPLDRSKWILWSRGAYQLPQ